MKTPTHVPTKLAFLFGTGVTAGVLAMAGCIIIGVLWYMHNEPAVEENSIGNTNQPAVVQPTDTVNMGALTHVRGTGDLTLIEYTDLECPYCKVFHGTLTKVMPDYDGRVRYGIKNFPLNIHPKARKEAMAAECAGQQGKYFEFVDEIFRVTPSNNNLDEAVLTQTAETLGLNMGTFNECVKNESFSQTISDDALEAQATGATGTPHTLIVNKDGKIITGIRGSVSEEQLRTALDGLLK